MNTANLLVLLIILGFAVYGFLTKPADQSFFRFLGKFLLNLGLIPVIIVGMFLFYVAWLYASTLFIWGVMLIWVPFVLFREIANWKSK